MTSCPTRRARRLLRAAVPLASAIVLAACGDVADPPAPAAAAPQIAATRTMPATAWAPQAPYSEARLSPFEAVR